MFDLFIYRTVREEFVKVLHNDLNNVISKDDFIKSLLEWFEASLNQEKNHTNGLVKN